MRCTVRRAAPKDAQALDALHKASVRALCAGTYSARQIEAWLAGRGPADYCRAMLAGETMLVAERDGQVVGFACVKQERLIGLYVDPVRGRGAGPTLLRLAEQHVRDEGSAVLSLQATLNAVAFYQRHGFVAERKATVLRGGRELAVVDMSKRLAGSPDVGAGY
jgi:putative acetyltransferase